jgi:acylphosphatase
MTRVHLLVRGRVQGVGFRWFVVRAARDELGLDGWVRNRDDGAVEIEVEGARQTLEDFVAAVRRGPPAAQVTGIETRWSEGNPQYRGFEVRH